MDDVDIHDRAFVADPFGAFERLRRECPVAHSSKHGGFWLLTRYDDVRSAALDWRSFTSSVVGVTAIPVITPRTQPQLPIEIDPPQHSRYRALVNPVFAPQRVAAITPRIEAFIRDRLETMATERPSRRRRGILRPRRHHLAGAFTDIPLADSERWVEWITRMFDVSDRERGAAASKELVAYVDALIAERRARPQDDFISTLISAEIDGERLDDLQIRSFVTVVFGAGFETTADALSLMLQWLAGNPDALAAALRSRIDPARGRGIPAPLLADPDFRPQRDEGYVPARPRPRNASDIVALWFRRGQSRSGRVRSSEEMRLDRRPNRHLTFGAGPHLLRRRFGRAHGNGARRCGC